MKEDDSNPWLFYCMVEVNAAWNRFIRWNGANEGGFTYLFRSVLLTWMPVILIIFVWLCYILNVRGHVTHRRVSHNYGRTGQQSKFADSSATSISTDLPRNTNSARLTRAQSSISEQNCQTYPQRWSSHNCSYSGFLFSTAQVVFWIRGWRKF